MLLKKTIILTFDCDFDSFHCEVLSELSFEVICSFLFFFNQVVATYRLMINYKNEHLYIYRILVSDSHTGMLDHGACVDQTARARVQLECYIAMKLTSRRRNS